MVKSELKYFIIGFGLLAMGSITAIVLNSLGASCLIELSMLDTSTADPEAIEAMERDCFIITNSYVYSVFAAVAGAIIFGYWYFTTRRSAAYR